MITEDLAGPIRHVSRQFVRELGFMNATCAGSPYHAAAVHLLIEIEEGNVSSLEELASALNLDLTSTRLTAEHLSEAGEITLSTDSEESRGCNIYADTASLTARGQASVAKIHSRAYMQVRESLRQVSLEDAQMILGGLQKYVAALQSGRLSSERPTGPTITIETGYKPALIGRTTQMHMEYHSRKVGFGAFHECQLATTLADMVSRLGHPKNGVWSAMMEDTIIGNVYIDGENPGSNIATLRVFIVDSQVRGAGVGSRLLGAAMAFVDEQGFAETHLWTYKGLDAARRLYEAHGFALAEEAEGSRWGTELVEQRLVRKTNRKI